MKFITLLLFIATISYAQYSDDKATQWYNSIGYPFETFSAGVGSDDITSAINDAGASGRCANGPITVTTGEVYRISYTLDFVSGSLSNYVSLRADYGGAGANVSDAYIGEQNEEGFNIFNLTASGTDATSYLQIAVPAAAEFSLTNIDIRLKIDTLWIDNNQADDTDADTTKTLAEAFETRGAHSGGTFIVCAGTYSESITIDSSFSKLEASGTASIGAIDFNNKTVTVDLANLTIISKTNDSNVTYLNAPSTSTESGSGYNNWGGFNGYLQSSSGTSTTPTDTTITLAITNSTANSTDSVDVTGTNDLLAFTDSTYWLINQADVAVTWANADEKNSYDGWQSTSTLAHGLASNGYVRVGLAALDVNGDTTAIAQRRHYVNVFTPAEDGALNIVLNTLLH